MGDSGALINPGSISGRPWVNPQSILDRSLIDPELTYLAGDPGSTLSFLAGPLGGGTAFDPPSSACAWLGVSLPQIAAGGLMCLAVGVEVGF